MTQLDLIRVFIKETGVGEVFTRTELYDFIHKAGCLDASQSKSNSADQYLSMLVTLGYILPEQYEIRRIVKLIPEDMTTYKLQNAYRAIMEKNKLEAIKAEPVTDSLSPLQKTPSCALLYQEGGTHYKDMVIQPIQVIVAAKLTFIQGNILKYISRYERKNGIEDIKKCKHYAQLAIDLKDISCKRHKAMPLLDEFIKANKLNSYQRYIVTQLALSRWENVIHACDSLIDKLQTAAKDR